MMDAQTLRNIIHRDLHLSLTVTGIYAVDTLPPALRPGQALIANTDVWRGEGLHWVTVYRNTSGDYEFFDSLGKTPQHYDERFRDFLHSDCSMYNAAPLQQSDSNLCGAYVLYYLYHRSRGLKMSSILSHFSTNCMLNDKIVKTFVDMMRIKSI